MHECHECGFVCDCDGDDLWSDIAAEACTCCEMGNASDAGMDFDPEPDEPAAGPSDAPTSGKKEDNHE